MGWPLCAALLLVAARLAHTGGQCRESWCRSDKTPAPLHLQSLIQRRAQLGIRAGKGACKGDCIFGGFKQSCEEMIVWFAEEEFDGDMVLGLQSVNMACEGQCFCGKDDFPADTFVPINSIVPLCHRPCRAFGLDFSTNCFEDIIRLARDEHGGDMTKAVEEVNLACVDQCQCNQFDFPPGAFLPAKSDTVTRPPPLQPTAQQELPTLPPTVTRPPPLRPTAQQELPTLPPTATRPPPVQPTAQQELPPLPPTVTRPPPLQPTAQQEPPTLPPTVTRPPTLQPTAQPELPTLPPTVTRPPPLQPTAQQELPTLPPTVTRPPPLQPTAQQELPTLPHEVTRPPSLQPTAQQEPPTLPPTVTRPPSLQPTAQPEVPTLPPRPPMLPSPAQGPAAGAYSFTPGGASSCYASCSSGSYTFQCHDEIIWFAGKEYEGDMSNAIETINKECVGQCECSQSDFPPGAFLSPAEFAASRARLPPSVLQPS